MNISSAKFVKSSSKVNECPDSGFPEFAFIGRSNVGKSSLINSLVNKKTLAQTSGRPGKTRLINHYVINDSWYLVDLPGYGYAGASKQARKGWGKMTEQYLLTRKSLVCTFVLIDIRIDPQKIDLAFIHWMGTKQLPFVLVFTKAEKMNSVKLKSLVTKFEESMKPQWESMPEIFITSASYRIGNKEVLSFVDKILHNM
ncbi:MAG: YihA family ribosome biogenesis GTP-binding protein [Flammeovirgaceae bacterium]|nr:YihA family ribosome biogenesis GTP-binding protein [Flammeovirgaceae bacterium]